jgi:hypothetical protein
MQLKFRVNEIGFCIEYDKRDGIVNIKKRNLNKMSGTPVKSRYNNRNNRARGYKYYNTKR